MLNPTCRTVLKSEIQARQGSLTKTGEIERLFIEVVLVEQLTQYCDVYMTLKLKAEMRARRANRAFYAGHVRLYATK